MESTREWIINYPKIGHGQGYVALLVDWLMLHSFMLLLQLVYCKPAALLPVLVNLKHSFKECSMCICHFLF